MTASDPPTHNSDAASFSILSRLSNSSFTAIRIAWKTAFAGFFLRTTAAGSEALMTSTNSSVVSIGLFETMPFATLFGSFTSA